MKQHSSQPNNSSQDAKWIAQLRSLQAFKAREGHCNVPANGRRNRSLARWLTKQRVRRKAGLLPQSRIAALDAVGVVWDPLTAQWEERLNALAGFKLKAGHCEVPRGYAPDPKLATWLLVQRRDKRLGKLIPERVAKLEEIGVVWDPHNAAWERQFEALATFRAASGHCNVPRGYSVAPALPTWITHQRAAKRRGQLSVDRAERLAALGFVWNPKEDSEESVFAQLERFSAEAGHCNVPETHPLFGSAGQWLTAQRMAKRKGTLSPDRVAKLEALGVSWDPHADAWEERFEALRHFHSREGNCDLPPNHRKDIGLYVWLVKQRADYRRGVLSPARTEKLEQLGIVWDTRSGSAPSKHRRKDGTRAPSWDAMCRQLMEFRNRYGDGNVPATYPANRALGSWLARQREKWRRGTLSAERAAQLETCGVDWDPILAFEEARFAEIEAYTRDVGHCNVPESHPTLSHLGHWLSRKRLAKRRGTLAASAINRLETLGIDWNPHESAWEEQFDAMRSFIQENGHCEIPSTTPRLVTLRAWATGQRLRKREGTLPLDRARRLDSIRFTWNPAEENLEAMFAGLAEYKSREGHCNVPYDYTGVPGLGTWLSRQRSARKRGTLDPERLARLDQLGVVWTPRWNGAIRIGGFKGKCCLFCAEPFTPTHGNAKYCSPDCYMSGSTSRDEHTGCHLWTGALDSIGRPHAHWNGKRRKAHIMAFTIAGGVLPEGYLLRHLCNNARCCNPLHLKVGTHVENMADKAASGIVAGENSYNASLTNQQARDIYKLRGSGSASAVAASLGVTPHVVHRIWIGTSYARATGAPRKAKGRPVGESNPAAKCSNAVVREIYAEKANGKLTAAYVAQKFGVSGQMVRNIWSGKSHSDITGAVKKDRNRNRKTQVCVVCRQDIGIVLGPRKYCSWQCALSARVKKGEPDECWLYTGKSMSGNYGQISFCGQPAMAHIVAFDLANPVMAEKRKREGLTVSHACHRSLCCNPSHLGLAPLRENAAANRGRPDISGENHPSAKLSLPVARAIKQLIAQGLENRQIVNHIKEHYGAVVTTMNVTDIRRRRAWTNLSPD